MMNSVQQDRLFEEDDKINSMIPITGTMPIYEFHHPFLGNLYDAIETLYCSFSCFCVLRKYRVIHDVTEILEVQFLNSTSRKEYHEKRSENDLNFHPHLSIFEYFKKRESYDTINIIYNPKNCMIIGDTPIKVSEKNNRDLMNTCIRHIREYYSSKH